MSSHLERIRDKHSRGYNRNALWFFVSLFGGGLAISLTKIATPHAWVAALVAAGVVIALMVYYLFNAEDAPEEEGDNVYYLGLLFTLVSLMFTLIELFGSGSESVSNADKIQTLLQNFGIALTSTVVGIAGRVALQNWQLARHEDSTELEGIGTPLSSPPLLPPAAGASLDDLAKFNRQVFESITFDLTNCANALAQFHVTVRSHARDTESFLLDHKESLQRGATSFREKLESNAETFAAELESLVASTLKTSESSITEMAKQSQTLTEQIHHSQTSYFAQLETLTRESIQSVHQNFELASKRAETLAETLGATHLDFNHQIREMSRTFNTEIRSISDQGLDILHRNLDSAAEQSTSLANNLSKANDQFSNVFEGLESGLSRATDASISLSHSVEKATHSTSVFELEVEGLREILTPLYTGIETLTSTLSTVHELDSRIRAEGYSTQIVETLHQAGETLKSIVQETQLASVQASKTFEAADTFAQNLKAAEKEILSTAEQIRTLVEHVTEYIENASKRRGLLGGWKLKG